MNQFDKSAIRAILGVIGCESLMYEAAVATVKGDNFQKKSNTDSLYSFESAGRTLCGVTSYTSLTPAGSFFVPDVRVGGKSRKDLYEGGSNAKPFCTIRNRNLFSRIILFATALLGGFAPAVQNVTPEPIV